MLEIAALKSTLGIAMSVVGTEHFMSAGLSSPWSTAKFAKTLEDKKEVDHYFSEAATSSLLFGGFLSYSLKSLFPIIGAGALVLYYKNLYNKALSGAGKIDIGKMKDMSLDEVVDLYRQGYRLKDR